MAYRGRLIQKFQAVIAPVSPYRAHRASVQSTTGETWDLAAAGLPGTLLIAVDGAAAQTVTLTTGDFADPAAATASEVAAAVSTALAGGEAWATASAYIVIASETDDDGTIQVTGGTLNATLLFPTVEVSGGYDHVMGGYLPYDDGTVEGAVPRREAPLVTLPCQLARGAWGRQASGASAGGDEVVDFTVALHRPDLEAQSLFDANGAPLFQRGDRLVKILETTGDLVEAFPDPPGTFVVGVTRGGYGLASRGANRKFNLVLLQCARRDVR